MYVKLKKKFGQNFLIDKNIITKIVNLIPSKNLDILEIGPGDGKLTDRIISEKEPKKLTLIEVDKDLIDQLSSKYSQYNFVKIVNNDILKTQIKQKYEIIISNLPYNISSQILINISLMKSSPKKIIFMFQKEFGSRLLEKKINSINSIIRCFYNIYLNFHVTKNCFRPKPKVDSSVLTFEKKEKSLLEHNEIEKFIDFKRHLFSHKRKMLKNLISTDDFAKNFDSKQRVEDLEINELIEIFRNIKI